MSTDAIDMSSAMWNRLSQLGFPIHYMDEDAAIAAFYDCKMTFEGDPTRYANQESEYCDDPPLADLLAGHEPEDDGAEPPCCECGSPYHKCGDCPAFRNGDTTGLSAEDIAWMKDLCPECGEYRPDDERVKAGMKCGYCAYGMYLGDTSEED